MRRWIYPAIVGTLIALIVSWAGFPFEDSFFRLMMRLRGPKKPNAEIVLVRLAEPGAQHSWHRDLQDLLITFSAKPPRLVALDFIVEQTDRQRIRLDHYPYSVAWQLRKPTAARLGDFVPIVSSPEYVNSTTGLAELDPFMVEILNADILYTIAPDQVVPRLSKPAQIVNFAGPPGTYTSYDIHELLKDPKLIETFENKIVLIAGPTTKTPLQFGAFPFFPRTVVRGVDHAELHANMLDTVLRSNGIQPLSFLPSFALTLGVSLATVGLLFIFSPLLSILGIVLLGVLLVLLSLMALNKLTYIPLQNPVFAIALAYYFLIPYRLIVEYKGRWKYQEENRLLSQVETLKDNFMSLVSHNLKTPIARIQGVVETLLGQRNELSDSTQESLESILRSTGDLNRFVSRILNLTKVEDPKFQIRTTSKDINSLIEQVVDKHSQKAGTKEISLETKLEPLFPVQLDTEMISESIANLVENAIKYTPKGGTVEISSSEDGDWVKVAVADSGPGIAEEETDKIFSKFFRGAEVKNKGVRGSGLGLYLVKYFVELHGGSIRVENRPDGGSIFTISLLRK